jgi:hypothetical protein
MIISHILPLAIVGGEIMRIEKKMTFYGYDLIINHVLHKRCLNCEKWYPFDGVHGFCEYCTQNSSPPTEKIDSDG